MPWPSLSSIESHCVFVALLTLRWPWFDLDSPQFPSETPWSPRIYQTRPQKRALRCLTEAYASKGFEMSLADLLDESVTTCFSQPYLRCKSPQSFLLGLWTSLLPSTDKLHQYFLGQTASPYNSKSRAGLWRRSSLDLQAITRPDGNPKKHQGNSFGYVQQLHLLKGLFLVKEKGP